MKGKAEFRVPAPGPVSVGTATLPGLRGRGRSGDRNSEKAEVAEGEGAGLAGGSV